ncbi:cytochrome ubiquinol oxidase subunit I [Streptomyces sp. NPDC006385]|uniref:cytochrome ubiquinol oxidase subunit I n=1 Tax=Streptomyces sp. NPDC006385 TaxID=3156761 RepID=UPI00339F5676
MARADGPGFGQAIGLPFPTEGIAFFLETIFLGLYLYAWDRLPPRVHEATGGAQTQSPCMRPS